MTCLTDTIAPAVKNYISISNNPNKVVKRFAIASLCHLLQRKSEGQTLKKILMGKRKWRPVPLYYSLYRAPGWDLRKSLQGENVGQYITSLQGRTTSARCVHGSVCRNGSDRRWEQTKQEGSSSRVDTDGVINSAARGAQRRKSACDWDDSRLGRGDLVKPRSRCNRDFTRRRWKIHFSCTVKEQPPRRGGKTDLGCKSFVLEWVKFPKYQQEFESVMLPLTMSLDRIQVITKDVVIHLKREKMFFQPITLYPYGVSRDPRFHPLETTNVCKNQAIHQIAAEI